MKLNNLAADEEATSSSPTREIEIETWFGKIERKIHVENAFMNFDKMKKTVIF